METSFFHPTSAVTENGRIVSTQKPPIIQVKKLNGQGTIYKLTDANMESINLEKSSNGSLDIERFVRSLRSNFGTGQFNFSSILHKPFTPELTSLGLIRLELNGTIFVQNDNFSWSVVDRVYTYVFGSDGVVIEYNSIMGIVSSALDRGEVSDTFMESLKNCLDGASEGIKGLPFSHFIGTCDKISVQRQRTYEP